MGDLGESFRDVREHQRRIRDARDSKFRNSIIPKLKQLSSVSSVKELMDKIVVTTTNFGTIDVYPKTNRLLIRDRNEWHSGAIHWLLSNL